MFKFLLDNDHLPIRKFYDREVKGTTPMVHRIIFNSRHDLLLLESYCEILRIIVEKFPEELNYTFKESSVDNTLESDSFLLVRDVLKYALLSNKKIEQELLESQIQTGILGNETIKRLLTGADKLSSDFCLEEKAELIPIPDISDFLLEKIQTLKCLLQPAKEESPRVSSEFYYKTFLPWVMDCERKRHIFELKKVPVMHVKANDTILEAINKIVEFVAALYKQERHTPEALHVDPVQRVCLEPTNRIDLKKELPPSALAAKFFKVVPPLAGAASDSMGLDELSSEFGCDG